MPGVKTVLWRLNQLEGICTSTAQLGQICHCNSQTVDRTGWIARVVRYCFTVLLYHRLNIGISANRTLRISMTTILGLFSHAMPCTPLQKTTAHSLRKNQWSCNPLKPQKKKEQKNLVVNCKPSHPSSRRLRVSCGSSPLHGRKRHVAAPLWRVASCKART